jgi:Acyl-CoA carboxylase epsilon subunit
MVNLRIVKGDLSPEEIAALVVVLTRRPAAPDQVPRTPAWSDRSRAVRRPLPHGPGAWRSSALP